LEICIFKWDVYFFTEQDGETSQALALMPSGTIGGHQMPQSSANVSAVGIPGYAAGEKNMQSLFSHLFTKKESY
jgi:hypothetical protein